MEQGEYVITPVVRTAPPGADKSVNIPELFRALRRRRGLIIFITAVCLVIGILYALLSPVEYKSEAQVLPEIGKSQQNQLGNLLNNYGGLLGLGNSGGLGSSENQSISPQVYPAIVKSLNFEYAMLQDTVYFADIDSSLTLYQYLKPRTASLLGKWFGGGNASPLKALPDSLRLQFSREQIESINTNQRRVIQNLRDRIAIEFESGTGVMQITARMPDAVAAAQVCNNAIKRLTDFVKQYRTQKARNILQFTDQQYEIGRRKFRDAQRALAKFKDKNVNLSTASAQSQEKYLQSEYNLAYNVYNSIAQKRIQGRMNLKKNTPVFKTLQSANVPLQRYEPRWIPIMLFSIAAGLALSFIIILSAFIFRAG